MKFLCDKSNFFVYIRNLYEHTPKMTFKKKRKMKTMSKGCSRNATV